MILDPKKRKRNNIIAGLFTVAAVYTIGCVQLAQNYLSPLRSHPPTPEGLREITLSTRLGEVPVWVTPNMDSGPLAKPVFVLVHGYGGDRGHWSDLARRLHRAGYGVVVPSMPGHDNSPDKTTGFGLKEGKLVTEVVRWVRKQDTVEKKSKVVLLGVSMGGAACWMAAKDDAEVQGIITEGAYARFDQAMNHWLNHALPGGSVILRPVVWIASGQSQINPAQVNPIEGACKWKGKPALIIQGGADKLILRHHADELTAALGCPEWIVPGAGHAMCYREAYDEYFKRVTAFADGL